MNLKLKQIFILLIISSYPSAAQWMQWECRLNNSFAEFGNFVQDMKTRGYAPVNLSVATSLDTTRISSLWQKANMDDWLCFYGLNQEAFLAKVETLKQSGFVPFEMAVWKEKGAEVQFAATWKRTTYDGFVELDIKESELKQKIIEYNAKGYSPRDFNGYFSNGTIYYSCIFDKEPKGMLSLVYGSSEAEFQQEMDKRAPSGYYPIHVSYFNDTQRIRWNAIWAKGADTWDNQKGYTLAEFQEYFNKKTDEGYIPIDVDQYCINGQFLFGASFTKSTKLRVTAAPISQLSNNISSNNLKNKLPIAPIEQKTKSWCWLAVGEMVFKHYNIPNLSPNENFQCGIAAAIFQHQPCSTNCLNNSCIGSSGLNFNTVRMLKDYTWLASKKVFNCTEALKLDFPYIKNNIDHQKPIICGISPNKRQYFLGAEHLVLVVGYELVDGVAFVVVNDPFPYAVGENPYGVILGRGQYLVGVEEFFWGLVWGLGEVIIE